VGGVVIVLVQKRPKSDVQLVETLQPAQMVEASLAQGPPESLHFAAGLRIAGTCMDQPDLQARADLLEPGAPVGRPVVEVHRIGLTPAAKRIGQPHQHVDLTFGLPGFQRDDHP
jgi:hypothetical protein